jgi:putative membrane protein
MWLWHAPVMCNAAATSVPVQHLQTLSLLAMGGAYWWPVIGPLRGQRLEPLRAAAYLFSACVACTILGIIVTFSPVSPCNAFAHPVDPAGALALVRDQWGLTAKMDQEIGGLLMWVPTCFVYTAAILAMLGRYWGAERRPAVKGGAA